MKVLSVKMPPLALLAGGRATRLGPLGSTTPKALVSVAEEPFISHQLRLFKREGIKEVVVCAGWLGEKIRAFVGDGKRFGLRVEYSFDGNNLLGTGGALKKALPMLGDFFWVMYGDSYLDIPFSGVLEHFLKHGKEGLMTVFRNDNRLQGSNVLFEGGAVRRYDKEFPSPNMRYIDYGLSLLRRFALKDRPAEEAFDLAEIYRAMAQRGELLGYEVKRRFYEVGSLEGIKEADAYLKRGGEKRTEEGLMDYVDSYLKEAVEIAHALDRNEIEKAVGIILKIRQDGGRLFFLGVGGGAGNAAHAVNDFRKIAGIESYAPTDNAAELTARVNDEGWDTVFTEWLKCSRLSSKDGVFVFSVGGGDAVRKISANIVSALGFAREAGAKVVGVVGRDGGYTAKVADACVIVPMVNGETVTPHTEAFQGVIWHLMVSHPSIKRGAMKWESVK